MSRRPSLWRQISRGAHIVSRTAGDLNALQSGGVPRLVKRVARRQLIRSFFQQIGKIR